MGLTEADARKQDDWFKRLPKVELHIHLEGAIPRHAVWQLLQKYGGDPQVPDLNALHERLKFHDFTGFIDAWCWKNRFLREYEDFTFIAREVARMLRDENVRYAEMFFSPTGFCQRHLQTQKLTEAVRKGLAQVPEIKIALIVDLVRDYPPEFAFRTLVEVAEARELGVIGVGLGGSEHLYPPEPFSPVFAEARRLGFRATGHAGEVAGAQSVWGSLRSLQIERIGHATRAIEDPELMDWLIAKQIPLEMCPHSNVMTGVVSSIREHPIRTFFERGALVTVNSDDPLMFNQTLTEEYRLLVRELGFTHDEIRQLVLNAIRGSWLSDEEQKSLCAEVNFR